MLTCGEGPLENKTLRHKRATVLDSYGSNDGYDSNEEGLASPCGTGELT